MGLVLPLQLLRAVERVEQVRSCVVTTDSEAKGSAGRLRTRPVRPASNRIHLGRDRAVTWRLGKRTKAWLEGEEAVSEQHLGRREELLCDSGKVFDAFVGKLVDQEQAGEKVQPGPGARLCRKRTCSCQAT